MSEPPRERSAERILSGDPEPNCQPFSVWLEICSGTMAHDAAMLHIQHAAQCRDCSALLAEANAAVEERATPEEDAILSAISTSTPTGQSLLAKRLYGKASSEKGSAVAGTKRRWGNLIPILSWTAAAACIAGIAFVLVFQQSSDTKLLAEAYNQQRPSELRLPETDPGPVASPTRGDTTVADSSELLRLKLRTQESFEKEPNDPAVRQMLGRIALVEHHGESALSSFEIAQALNPNLPGLLFDMASAHFELAESTGRSSEYGQAADLFRQYLAVHPGDPVALFNLALCWERQGATTEAVSTFQSALAVERNPRWRQEIQSHLATLNQTSALHQPAAVLQQSLTPAAFLSSHQDPPGYFELLLGIAGRDWLPHRGSDPQTDAALKKLAALGSAHHDDWIADMLRVPLSDRQRIADQTLSQALVESSHGNADQTLALSAEAMRLYRVSGSRPGYLRAAAEHLYTLQRMGLNEDCLHEAAALTSDPQLSRYPWLNIYLQLERSAAFAMMGNTVNGRRIASAAALAAQRAGFPLSYLRATSFVVNDDVSLQHYASAWDRAASGLRATDPVMGSAMPRFQLLSALISIAKRLNLRWTQAGFAEEAAVAARSTANQQTAAYAMEELALDDLQIADLPGASRSFHEADQLLASLGDGPAKRRYAADWKTDRVLLTARVSGPAAAVQILERNEPDYRKVDAALPRLHFYTVYADLLRQAHQTPASIRVALIAITDAEHELADFHTAADRQGWPEETRTAYEILVADLAENTQDPALSLRAWEWLQSAPSREGRAFTGELQPQDLDRILPPIPREQSGHLALVVAKVLNNYIAWSIGPDQQHPVLRQTLVAAPDSVAHRGAVLLRLCSDPRSSLQDVNALGQSLYRDLLGPFDNQIAAARQLDLDIDAPLAQVPFAVLQHDGRYLGLEHPLMYLPAGWFADAAKTQTIEDAARLTGPAGIVILRQSPQTAKPFLPSDYDESGDIARLFPNTQLRSATLWRSGADISLSGPPDLSALLSHATVVHYLGHGLDDAAQPAAANSADPILNLSGHSLAHCHLAVLAACQTLHEREEDSEDVPSFARIILAAGATHVLATQWDVDSQMTSRLMQRFYSSLADHDTFSEALRQAQQSLESDPASAHPYFWSGFQLVGD